MKKRAYSAIDVNKLDMALIAQWRPGQPGCLGIDMAKQQMKLMLRWADDDFERPWHASNPFDIHRVILLMQTLSQGRDLKIAMEPTGTYGDPLRQAMNDNGLVLRRVSPKASHDYAEVFDGVPSQHDGKDAAIVAELCAYGKSTPWPWRQLDSKQQMLVDHVERMDLQRRLANIWRGKLEGVLARFWPESLQIMNLTHVTFLSMLAQYGGPAKVLEDSANCLKPAKGFHAQEMTLRIRKLVDSARWTVGVRQTDIDRRRVRRYARRLKQCYKLMGKHQRRITALAEGMETIQRQAKVVGIVTASVLWVCLGDVQNYYCGQAYRKAMGMNLAERSSGKHKGQLKITKRGSAMVRRWLYMAAQRQIVKDQGVKRWYQQEKRAQAKRLRKCRGRPGTAAIVAVARRLALALYVVGTAGVVYNPACLFPSTTPKPKNKGVPAIA